MSRRARLLAALALLSCATPSCDKSPAPTPQAASVDLPPATPSATGSDSGTASSSLKKTAECSALVKVINASVERMEKIERSPQTDAGPTGPLLAMAGAMTTAEREVADLVLTLPKLRALAKRYRDMAGDVARNARDFVTAIDKIDAAAMSKAQIGLEAGVKREDPIIKQVNTYCHQP